MAITSTPGAWNEFALISIRVEGGSDISFESLTEDITDITFGEKDIEVKPMVSGGNVVRTIPMSEESITFKTIPITVGVDGESTATGVIQLFHPQASGDSTMPIVVDNTTTRNKHRIVILMATTLPANAVTIPSSVRARRIQIFNAYMTSVKPSFDDKHWSCEVTFKWAPFDKDGTRNMTNESTNAGTALDAVTDY